MIHINPANKTELEYGNCHTRDSRDHSCLRKKKFSNFT